MAKTTKPIAKQNANKKDLSRAEVPTSPWIEEYRDCFGWKMIPVTQLFLEKFSADLVNWARLDDNAYRVTQFLGDKGVPRDTFYDWCKKHPIMEAARKQAMMFLADRREIGALKKQLDPKMVMFTQHLYDPEWKQADKYHADLKTDEDKRDVSYTVIYNKPTVQPKELLKEEVDGTQGNE